MSLVKLFVSNNITNKLTSDIYDRSFYIIYWRYTNHLTLKMTSTQIVETSVNAISNSPFQDYIHPDDRTLLNYEVFFVNFMTRKKWPPETFRKWCHYCFTFKWTESSVRPNPFWLPLVSLAEKLFVSKMSQQSLTLMFK